MPEEKQTEEMCLKAFRQSGFILEKLKKDPKFMLKAITCEGIRQLEAWEQADASLKNDYSFMLDAIRTKSHYTFRYLDPILKKTVNLSLKP